jgi:diguanylate cyclase (GGDEF)-like protein
MQNDLSLFIQNKVKFLQDHWRKTTKELFGQMDRLGSDPIVFDELKGLLMDLVALVERSGSVEQAVDAEFKGIVNHLKALQTNQGLSSTEMVLLLFAMRDSIRGAIREVVDQGVEGQHWISSKYQEVSQVSSLLNRLGMVFFEGSMRLQEDELGQDAMAIEYALLYERTRQVAITDKLTGLYNFGYFHERLKEERMRAERYHRLLSVIMFDLDHFKKYNDHNGHPAGNEVLKRIAAILKEEAREVDIVARYGGEEMVLVLPETSRKRAAELAERIRKRIHEATFEHMEKQPLGRITVSAGVATFPVDAENEDELIKKADACLYEAKSRGRNKVVAFQPPIQIPIHYKSHRDLTKVAIVGNFNNWDKDVDLMERQPDGSFQFVISLNPGVYHYKFVLNDVEWIPDPGCPERVHDTLGGDNSVLRVKA